MRTQQPLAIFSVDRTARQLGCSHQTALLRNHAARAIARDALAEQGLTWTNCEGCWDDNIEVSFAVHLPSPPDVHSMMAIRRLCRDFNQDAFILVSGYGAATLVEKSRSGGYSKKTHLGQWRRAISDAEVEEAGRTTGYTVDVDNGICYVIV